ncbi:MAG: sigma-70 family RNA polymerase sigma factor [Planctomycetes bacterium]|nr:sigma-70 family RNA polymerase sigma factor [Planctomycetota bacterium]
MSNSNRESANPSDGGIDKPKAGREAEIERGDARVAALSQRIIDGDKSALAELFSIYRPRLWRMVNFRLHPRLQGRVDPDDVLQDAWIMAVNRISYFLRDATHSSFIWFRMIVNQTLIDLHRHHLGAEKRNAARDVSVNSAWASDSTSSSMAFHLSGNLTSPSSAVNRAELAQQLDTILQGMNEIDREVLALRHFEELSNSETARVLNMSEQAASGRYIRALGRLKQILEIVPGFLDDKQAAAARLRRGAEGSDVMRPGR